MASGTTPGVRSYISHPVPEQIQTGDKKESGCCGALVDGIKKVVEAVANAFKAIVRFLSCNTLFAKSPWEDRITVLANKYCDKHPEAKEQMKKSRAASEKVLLDCEKALDLCVKEMEQGQTVPSEKLKELFYSSPEGSLSEVNSDQRAFVQSSRQAADASLAVFFNAAISARAFLKAKVNLTSWVWHYASAQVALEREQSRIEL